MAQDQRVDGYWNWGMNQINSLINNIIFDGFSKIKKCYQLFNNLKTKKEIENNQFMHPR